MPKVITEGAQMKCNKGAGISKIKITSQDHATIEGKLQATAMDLAAETNIPSFGKCSVTRSNCTSQAIKWDNTSAFSTIGGHEELTVDSTCKCALGGVISFVSEVTNTFVDNTNGEAPAGNVDNSTPETSTKTHTEDKDIPDSIIIGAVVIVLVMIAALIILALVI